MPMLVERRWEVTQRLREWDRRWVNWLLKADQDCRLEEDGPLMGVRMLSAEVGVGTV